MVVCNRGDRLDGHIVTNSHVIKGCVTLTSVQDSASLATNYYPQLNNYDYQSSRD